MSNPNYGVSGHVAFAIEQVLKRDWTFQLTSAIPLIACIKDRDLHFNKGHKVSGTKALIPLVYTDIAAFNTGTAGVADANEIPVAWPSYDPTEGFTQAEFEFTHMRRAMTLKHSEKTLAGNGARGNLLDGKTKQLMAKFRAIMADWTSGNQNASRTQGLGIQYAINTANTVGGINQAAVGNEYWQGRVTDLGAAAIALTNINTEFDAILRYANDTGDQEAPDLMVCSFNGTGTNCFDLIRSKISPSERFQHQDFMVKYGIANFVYMGMKAVMDNRGLDKQIAILTTRTWHYGGYEYPQAQEPIRIPGSDAEERMYTMWYFLGCEEIRRNSRIINFT